MSIQTAALALIAALACGCNEPTARPTPARKPAQAAQTLARPVELVFEKPNPYRLEVEAQRAKWETKRPASYAYVLELPHQIRSHTNELVRVEVRDGRAVSGHSVLYGGTASPKTTKTMDEVFDEVTQMASFGEGGVPARFEWRLDETYGYPTTVEADGRIEVADDESSLTIPCFSVSPDGCMPNRISQRACASMGGRLMPEAADGCDVSAEAIGLVGKARLCCRPFEPGPRTGLNTKTCHALGGRKEQGPCGVGHVVLGTLASDGGFCCRSLADPQAQAKSKQPLTICF